MSNKKKIKKSPLSPAAMTEVELATEFLDITSQAPWRYEPEHFDSVSMDVIDDPALDLRFRKQYAELMNHGFLAHECQPLMNRIFQLQWDLKMALVGEDRV